MKNSDYSNTNKVDIQWIFTLFGTAVGAGLLYLPVQAGDSGFWASLTVMIFALPLTYFSHRNMSNIVINAQDKAITGVFTHNLGKFFGFLCVVLYFLAIFLNMPMYSIGLNNELGNFLYKYSLSNSDFSHQIWFSFLILTILMTIVSLGINIILKFMQFIVISLIIMVIALSIYVVPYWNGEFITKSHFEIVSYIKGVLMVLPILILSMNHSPVVSSLVVFYKENMQMINTDAKIKVYKILKINAYVLFIFVLLFVSSCLLSTTVGDLNIASINNLSIVTLIEQQHPSAVLRILGPMIIFTAIISSFVGCYIGSREALRYLFKNLFKTYYNLNIKDKYINALCIFIIFIVLWICTICDFKILNIIGILVAPTVAFLLYILPVIVIYQNVRYQEYRKAGLNIMLVIIGLTIIFGYIIGLLIK